MGHGCEKCGESMYWTEDGGCFFCNRKRKKELKHRRITELESEVKMLEAVCESLASNRFKVIEERDEAREAARWHFAKGGTFSAEVTVKRWPWLGTIDPKAGPIPQSPQTEEK